MDRRGETGGVGGKRGKEEERDKRTGRKREGGVPSYACRIHGTTGEKKRGASSYNHVSRITPEVRGGGLKLSAGLDEVSNCGCKYLLNGPIWTFSMTYARLLPVL